MDDFVATDQEISLTVPSMPEFLRVARVTASGLASRIGFSIDEVDDLRLALDELCFALIGKGDTDGELRLTYALSPNKLSIEGCFRRQAGVEALELGELSRQILTALIDDHRLWESDGNGYFALTKSQSPIS